MSKELNDVLEAFNRAKSDKAQADAIKAQMAEQALLTKMLHQQNKELANQPQEHHDRQQDTSKLADSLVSSNSTRTTSCMVSAVSSTFDSLPQAVQSSTQPMCMIAEASTRMASNNTISFASSGAIDVVESLATPTTTLFAPIASQQMCALSEVGQCLVSNNTSTALALGNAGTACSTIGQCAVSSSSNLLVPAIAFTAAAVAAMAAGFAFRSMFSGDGDGASADARPSKRRRIISQREVKALGVAK